MSEEQTDRLEGGTPFEIRVLRELSNINHRLGGLESRMDRVEARLTNLEEKVEAQLYDTRPIWESVLSRLDVIETRLDRMETRLDSMDTRLNSVDVRLEKVETKFAVVADELLDMRTDVHALKKRPPAA